MEKNTKEGYQLSTMTVVAGALIILGLFLLMVFVGKAQEGQKLSDEQTMEQASKQAIADARLKAATALTTMQAEINAGAKVSDETKQNLNEAKVALKEAYKDSSLTDQAAYVELESGLNRLSTRLDTDISKASADIITIMSSLESDLTDEMKNLWRNTKNTAAELKTKASTTVESMIESNTGSSTLNLNGTVNGGVEVSGQ